MKPSRPLLLLVAGLLLIGLALGSASALGHASPALLPRLWWSALLALALVAVVDALWLRRQPSPHIERQLPGNLSLGRWSEVQLDIQHTLAHDGWLEIFDHVPQDMEFAHLPQRIALHPGETSHFRYRLRPLKRGHFHFPLCEVHLPSPMRLWLQRRRLELPGATRVYPDFARLYGAQLTVIDQWLNQLGVRARQRRGLGLDFHQLRDFRDGDTLRQIDWKATARKRTPIAREYQDERDQQVLFMIDCGRRMRSQDGDLSHFDHALNASLLLSYVALRQGDAVGLTTFASDQPRFLPPNKGPGQLSLLLNAVYDLHSTQRPADFSAAVDQVLARQRRRALIVVLSNLRDEDDEELLGAMRRLARRHRVLLASLREEVLDRLRLAPIQTYEDALGYCGTLDYLNARADLHERLIAHGLPVLDVRPSELGPELVSHYLAWKKAGSL